MSYWTHITAVFHVNTYKDTDDLKSYIEDKLAGAPKITGSERPAAVFVNVMPGYNASTSCDCNRCEYGNTVKHYDDGFECDSPEGFVCPAGEYQTCAVITVCGGLRDRTEERTKREYKEFRNYLKIVLDWEIINSSFSIKDY